MTDKTDYGEPTEDPPKGDSLKPSQKEPEAEVVPSWEELRVDATFVLEQVELSYKVRSTRRSLEPLSTIATIVSSVGLLLTIVWGSDFLDSGETLFIVLLTLFAGSLGASGLMMMAARERKGEAATMEEMALRLRCLLSEDGTDRQVNRDVRPKDE